MDPSARSTCARNRTAGDGVSRVRTEPSREAEMGSAEDASRKRRVADCAWCGAEFRNIVELLTHVEDRHLASEANVAA
jgi:hypothetical protein